MLKKISYIILVSLFAGFLTVFTQSSSVKNKPKAQARVDKMMQALGGRKNWAEIESLYIRAIHKEEAFKKPYQSEILRNLDSPQFRIIQQDDKFFRIAYVNGMRGWIKRGRNGTIAKMSDKGLAGLLHWNKHLVYGIFRKIALRTPGLRFEIDKKDRLLVYENGSKLSAFELNDKNLPYKFYSPKLDAEGENLSIFTSWSEGNGLIYPTTSETQDEKNKAIYVALEWKPSKTKANIKFPSVKTKK